MNPDTIYVEHPNGRGGPGTKLLLFLPRQFSDCGLNPAPHTLRLHTNTHTCFMFGNASTGRQLMCVLAERYKLLHCDRTLPKVKVVMTRKK